MGAAVHRYEESIGGHPYLIEVVSVSTDRWRAYIVRRPGVPTALMPFYGRTPDEAAHDLSDWLARAHQRGRWRYIARLVLIDGTTEIDLRMREHIADRFRGAA